MDTIRICKQCQKPVPEAAPEGLCPECLAKVALGSEPATGERIPPTPADLAAQFPQLEIIELLGMGGMGMVYKARQPKLDRLVALKILSIQSSRDPSFAERFEREARALARLNHPGIVAVYDFGQTKDFYYFIMEFVDGMNLRELLQTEPISPQHALELVTQICTALQFAHDEKIVHRDIKPENILINKRGQAKIADFGLAKLLGNTPETNLTASQMLMGSINYMAPEQRERPLEVDHRADIYSLGVVFYEMLTGEVPMGRFDVPSKKVRIDVRLDDVVLRALEREPARRYQKASEVRTGVETIAATMKPSGQEKQNQSPMKPPITFKKVALNALLYLCFVMLFEFLSAPGAKSGTWWLITLAKFGAPMVFILVIAKWVLTLQRGGLKYRDLPPKMARRLYLQIIGLVAVIAAAFFVFFMIFPIKIKEFKEWWFLPNSAAYEKLGFAGEFTRYNQPLGNNYYAAPDRWKVALKIYGKNTNNPPAVMNVTLPGLRAEYLQTNISSSLPLQCVLDREVLADWLRVVAKLDVTAPKVQNETKEIMDLLKSFEIYPPHTADEFVNLAKADLKDFPISGYYGNTNFDGSFSVFIELGVILLAGYFTGAAWLMRRTFDNFRKSQGLPPR